VGNANQPAAQRKQATVIFADLSGFTEMSEKLDPEQVREIVNRYFESLASVVQRYEGTIDKYIGDCVMAVFGVPSVHQNDPERACRAALEMQQRVRELAAAHDASLPRAPELHIGINSGLVVAAPMGSSESSQFTVMGDTVNLASRLCHEAQNGQIGVGESTWEQVKGHFEFAPRELRTIKGKSGKTPVYFLNSLRKRRVMAQQKVKFVGRQRETALVEGLIEEAAARRGSLLYVTGEPGVGKSRFVEEAAAAAQARGFRRLSAAGQPFESMQAYGPWRQILFSCAGIAEDSAVHEASSALEEWINSRSGLEAHTAALHATCAFAAEEFELLDEASRSRRMLAAWNALLHTIQAERPVFLFLDDLQWADPQSLSLIDALGDSLAGLAVVLCCAARPEFKHSWSGRSYYQQISLRPLSNDDSVALARELLAEKKLVASQEQWIAERAEGNPFYVAELTRAVAERGTAELPPTIQGIIMQRVDQLEKEARRVLEVASVIGREFPEKVLRAVSGAEELEGELARLRQLELVYEKEIVPELQYIFKHYLTQEATYNSILIEKRKQLHREVAGAIEAIYRESLERRYAVLAQHLEKAGDFKRAFEYYRLAGERAQESQSEAAGLALLKKGEEALEKLYEFRPRLRDVLKAALLMGCIVAIVGTAQVMSILGRKMVSSAHWYVLPAVMLAFLALVGAFAFYRSAWSFLVYADKIRVRGRRRYVDIAFAHIESADLVPYRKYSPVMAIHPRYNRIGEAQFMQFKGPGSVIRIRLKPNGWRRGYYLDMPEPKPFYDTLNRALERYRAVHASAVRQAAPLEPSS
jgi:class 3 adenylate cyclase